MRYGVMGSFLFLRQMVMGFREFLWVCFFNLSGWDLRTLIFEFDGPCVLQ